MKGKAEIWSLLMILLAVFSTIVFIILRSGFIGDLFGIDGEKTDVEKNKIIDMGAYYVDKYEASRSDATLSRAGSDNSRACSVAGVLPWVNVQWSDAKAACEARGPGWGLCSDSEWEDACDGTPGRGGNTHPYGDNYVKSTCNGYDAGHGKAMPTGNMTGCTSKDGAHDMSGNVWEWSEDKWRDYRIIRGGNWRASDSSLKCFSSSGVRPTAMGDSIGFRCCRKK